MVDETKSPSDPESTSTLNADPLTLIQITTGLGSNRLLEPFTCEAFH